MCVQKYGLWWVFTAACGAVAVIVVVTARYDPVYSNQFFSAKGAVRQKISLMSVEEKIGQMFMVGVPDKVLSKETSQWLRERHLGGVILLGQNTVSADQVRALTRALQLHTATGDRTPLFIAVDQEGEPVLRFRFLQELIGQRDLRDTAGAYDVAKKRGFELKSLGVNINFSPVLDVVRNGTEFIYARTFRGDAKLVGELGSAMIKGYRESGVIPVVKHFPGHGGTSVDSHKNLPELGVDETAWQAKLLPFRRAIREKVEMIMVGHLKVPFIDQVFPASLSSTIISGVLRKELGYQGIIITDELGMGAVTNTFSLADAAVHSVKAGVDIVLAVRPFSHYEAMYSALVRAVREGDVPMAQIDASAARILVLKKKFLEGAIAASQL